MKRLLAFLLILSGIAAAQISPPPSSGGGGTGTVTKNGSLATGKVVIGGTNGTTDIKTDTVLTSDGAGTVTGGVSITSTAFVGALTGNASSATAVPFAGVANPLADKAFTMAANRLNYNFTADCVTTYCFSITSAGGSAFTPPLVLFSTGASNTQKVLAAYAQGTANGVELSSTGALSAVGTGAIDATTLGTKTFASPAAIGTGTPAAITGTTITANTGFSGPLTGNVTGNVSGSAATATTATNATNVGTAADATNATYSLAVLPSTTGNQAVKTVSGLTVNPSTGATAIPGAVTAPSYTANGTTAGYLDLPQGTTNSAGTTSIRFQAPPSVTSQLRTLTGTPATGFVKWTNTAGSMAETIAALANTDLPTQLTAGTKTGIYNFNQAAQSQVVVSATEYYITNSDLDMPAAYTTAIAAGTTMEWRVAMTKTAAGTGTFQILLKKGTNGAIADATLATITIGTQTAAADNMEMDISLTWTSATAAYWTVVPHQAAATGTGFGLVYPAAAAQFSGTISAQTTTTASDKYGLSFKATTGTPTIVVNLVKAHAFGVN